uniref:Apple domain-containing protein n=1 Tax=Romanomermis culicivorax TaxID=13658 RepID=A0A915IRV3_ROMCU
PFLLCAWPTVPRTSGKKRRNEPARLKVFVRSKKKEQTQYSQHLRIVKHDRAQKFQKMSALLLRQVIMVILPFWIAGQCTYDQKCWFGSVGCTLATGNPFERRAFISCDECMKLCMERKNGPPPYCCKSAVYDAQWKFCDLFAVKASRSSDFVRYPGRVYLQPIGNCTSPVASIVDCPAGQKAVLNIFQNSSIPTLSNAKPINADTSDKCGLLCVQNKDDKGNVVQCKAASFSQGKCQFSDQAPDSNTIKNLRPGSTSDPNSLYIEKKCFPSDQAGTCDAIILDPHHVLVGYNRKTITTDNCILNEETRETKPDLYLATDDNNIYFEPQCATTGNQIRYALRRLYRSRLLMRDLAFHQSSEHRYSDFSDCDKATNTKYRYKNCMAKRVQNCEKEFVPCDFVDMDAIFNARIKTPMLCKPILKGNNKPDCSRGVMEDVITGARKYGCIPNTAECHGKINFS